MNMYIKWLLTLALYGLSCSAYASDSFAFGWTSPASDKSIEFLGQLFGPVGTALGGADAGILGTVVQIFNIAVLALGSIVVSYTIIVSTMNTAQEGEVMGRKWSSAWIPLRAALGTAMLIPAPTYSLIQILFMQVTLMGVHAANQIWALVMNNMDGAGVHGTTTVDDSGLEKAVKHLMEGLICAEHLNKIPSMSKNGSITAYAYDSNNDGDPDRLYIGVPGEPAYAKICGGLEPNSPPSTSGASSNNAANYAETWISYNISALENTAAFLSAAAAEAEAVSDPLPNADPPPISWSGVGTLIGAKNVLKGGIASTPRPSSLAPSSSSEQTSIDHGWLYAGSYYFEFAGQDLDGSGSTRNSESYGAPSTISPAMSAIDSQTAAATLTRASTLASRYFTYSDKDSGVEDFDQGAKLSLSPPAGMNSEISSFIQPLIGPLEDLAEDFMDTLTTYHDDPIASIRHIGSTIMVVCEDIWFAIIIAAFAVLLLTCMMSGVNPLCWAVSMIGTILMPILTLLLGLLWVIGVTMGVYTPMIPYLVFTFTALGWFILVIETIIAAPIVALGIVSPASEVLGKAAPAVMLITGVFLRPSLMVIGFIGATLLVRTVIEMINYGFSATLDASVAGVGLFGLIAVIALYGGLVLAVVHECFSLVYVLPDKILRWIGGQAEQSSVAGQVKELEKSTQKGAEVASGVMKGSAQFATEKVLTPVAEKGMTGMSGMAGMAGMGGGGGGAGPSF